jgi:MarR-like DNA-binding transcriptional regulator SgrR of sgrS sRNA
MQEFHSKPPNLTLVNRVKSSCRIFWFMHKSFSRSSTPRPQLQIAVIRGLINQQLLLVSTGHPTAKSIFPQKIITSSSQTSKHDLSKGNIQIPNSHTIFYTTEQQSGPITVHAYPILN